MKVDAEIHRQAPGWTPGVQKKIEKRDYMNKGWQVGRGLKIMAKSTETANQRSRELKNSRPTAEEATENWTRPFPCGQELCSLVHLKGCWQWDQDLSQVHEQGFGIYSL